jgi:hypothetical protein
VQQHHLRLCHRGGAAPQAAQVLAWLAVTFVLGASFVALEISEFTGMYLQGAGPQRSGFLSAFFTLVGTHGLHVSNGLVWILIMSIQVLAKGLTEPVASRLFRLGLFCAGLSDARAATQVLAGADGRRPTSAKARNRGDGAASMQAALWGFEVGGAGDGVWWAERARPLGAWRTGQGWDRARAMAFVW